MVGGRAEIPYIAEDFQYGEGLQLGRDVIIESNVVVGNNVKLGHRCTLKSGTRIGDNSVVDDHCITTGACWIGNNVNVRTGATVSKATIIDDWVFIGPGVITNHTKHVGHGRSRVRANPMVTFIGRGSIIGSQVSLLAGLFIGASVIVGGGSVVVKDIYESGVYVGNPLRRLGDLPEGYTLDEIAPWGVGLLEKIEHLKRCIGGLNVVDIERQIRTANGANVCT